MGSYTKYLFIVSLPGTREHNKFSCLIDAFACEGTQDNVCQNSD